jgi:branched-chain amino acid transport system ATP-binding protein
MAVVGDAPVVLLDEPTAGMGADDTQRFTELIRELTEGKTLVTVEHDMGVVMALADRVAVLVRGQVVALDSPQAVRADPAVQAAYWQPEARACHRPAIWWCATCTLGKATRQCCAA